MNGKSQVSYTINNLELCRITLSNDYTINSIFVDVHQQKVAVRAQNGKKAKNHVYFFRTFAPVFRNMPRQP
jgi:hypothetical protein